MNPMTQKLVKETKSAILNTGEEFLYLTKYCLKREIPFRIEQAKIVYSALEELLEHGQDEVRRLCLYEAPKFNEAANNLANCLAKWKEHLSKRR